MGTRNFLFSVPIKISLAAHLTSSTMGTGALFQVIGGWGVALITHLLIVQRLKLGRSILLPPLCASKGMLRATFAFMYNLTEPKRQQKFCSFIIIFTILLPVNRKVRCNEPLSHLLVNLALQSSNATECGFLPYFTNFPINNLTNTMT